MSYEQFYSNRDVVSLFSGAMGLDIGLQQAGLNVVIGQDFEPACVETMKANGHNVLGGDIREIQPQQLLDLTGLQRGEPFLICGGPPCQPFSTAGKRLGINDPRGSLFMDFIRMIDYIRPRFFIMENVKGIMSAPLKHVPGAERDESDPDQKLGTVLDVILSEFNDSRIAYIFSSSISVVVVSYRLLIQVNLCSWLRLLSSRVHSLTFRSEPVFTVKSDFSFGRMPPLLHRNKYRECLLDYAGSNCEEETS